MIVYVNKIIVTPSILFFLFLFYIENDDNIPISPWHDVSLHPGRDTNVYNMIIEIPRGKNAKIEVRVF